MNNNDNLNNSENVNEGYLKEMENNNYLFNEKIKKLNNLLVNSNNINNNYENKFNNKKINRGNFDNNHKEINKSDSENDFNSKENEIMAEEIMKKNYNNRDSESDFYKNKNYMLKDKDLNNEFSYENIKAKNLNKSSNNKFTNFKSDEEKIIKGYNNDTLTANQKLEYEKEIKQLKNENEYNKYVIDDLKNQLNQKNNKEEKLERNIISEDEYNNLLKETESKDLNIKQMKEEIKNLKFKIDNLIIENKKIKTENDSLKMQKDELKAEVTINKTDNDNNLEKLNKLELMNKKLNNDYLNLSNDYKKLKEEKDKLKSIIDEQNATIFNYEKQLSSRPKFPPREKMNDFGNMTSNEGFGIKYDKKYELNKFDDEEYKYNYSNEKRNKYNDDDYSYNKMELNRDYEENQQYRKYNRRNDYNENSFDNNLKNNNSTRMLDKNYFNEKEQKYDYNKNDINMFREYNKSNKYNMKRSKSKPFEIVNLKNKKLKKGELNYLENYLNSLLKERSKLEKTFNEIPEHPRTLNDVKLKNNIRDKIEHNANEITITQQQLKNIRES